MAASKILLIDDDADIRSVCRMVLQKSGYRIIEAASASEGKKLVEGEKPDLIILDIIMEEADSGMNLAGWLAKNHPAIPVVMLSSIADAAEQTFDTSTLKVAELINKPVDPKDLLATVERLLKRAASRP